MKTFQDLSKGQWFIFAEDAVYCNQPHNSMHGVLPVYIKMTNDSAIQVGKPDKIGSDVLVGEVCKLGLF